jgi:hypothetical protein
VKIPFGQRESAGQTYIDLSGEITAAILQTVERGWEIAKQRREVNPLAKEILMTECLRDGMREALRNHQLPWCKTMVVLPGTESRSNLAVPVRDGRTDIPLMFIEIFLAAGEHDPHAIIECKRVAEGDATLIREYVTEGVDRFCSGKYGKTHGHGFMAGYVLRGSPQSIVGQVNAFLQRHGRGVEQLGRSGAGWTSEHQRKNWRSIQLHHGMFSIN